VIGVAADDGVVFQVAEVAGDRPKNDVCGNSTRIKPGETG